MFDAHVAETHQSLELRPDSFAKIGEGDGFDIERVRARQVWIRFLMLPILIERDWSILGDDELRSVLKRLEFAGDAPETRFDLFLSFECLAPDFESDCAGSVARGGVAEDTALLSSALADRGYDDEALRKLANENWIRVLRKTWGA